MMKTLVIVLALTLSAGCAIRIKGEAAASMFKKDVRDAERTAANNVVLAKILLQAGISAAEVRRQLELGGATTEEADRVTTAAQALCGCGK